MQHATYGNDFRKVKPSKGKRWSVTDFVRVLFKFRGIRTSRQTLHRWIRVGVNTKNGELRRLECYELGPRKFLTLDLFDRFMSRAGAVRQTRNGQRDGFVYAITDGHGAVKIGFTSSDPNLRLRDLNVGHPYKLKIVDTVPGTLGTESAIHRRLKHIWIRGEWFQESPDITEAFEFFRR